MLFLGKLTVGENPLRITVFFSEWFPFSLFFRTETMCVSRRTQKLLHMLIGSAFAPAGCHSFFKIR